MRAQTVFFCSVPANRASDENQTSLSNIRVCGLGESKNVLPFLRLARQVNSAVAHRSEKPTREQVMTHGTTNPIAAEVSAAQQRIMLVRLCGYLTGDPEVAEDLAQETLLEAWRHDDALRDRQRYVPWLAGIARNVCRRWARSTSRDRAHRAIAHDAADSSSPSAEYPDAFDIESEFDRSELAALVDRALAFLPSPTRAALIERYVNASPYATIAIRLGISEGAAKVRVQRGKRALRRVILSQFPHDAIAHGLLIDDRTGGWQETRIWCPMCGRRRYLGRFAHDPLTGAFALRCPDCHPEPATVFTNGNRGDVTRLLAGITGYKCALSRTATWAHSFYRAALAGEAVACPHCGHHCHHTIQPPDDRTSNRDEPCRFHVACERCGWQTSQSFTGLVQALPESQVFWRAHPRMRTLPPRVIDYAGRAALVTTLRSIDTPAALDIISARDSFAVLAVRETPTA